MKVVTLRDMMDSGVIKLNTYNILFPKTVLLNNSQKIFVKTFNFL